MDSFLVLEDELATNSLDFILVSYRPVIFDIGPMGACLLLEHLTELLLCFFLAIKWSSLELPFVAYPAPSSPQNEDFLDFIKQQLNDIEVALAVEVLLDIYYS